jgi:hypothetical protein
MKQKFLYALVTLALAFFSHAFAYSDCTGKVVEVQNEAAKLLVRLNISGVLSGYLNIGNYGTSTATQATTHSNLSIVLTALAAGKTITVLIPDGVSCTLSRWDIPAAGVRINSN